MIEPSEALAHESTPSGQPNGKTPLRSPPEFTYSKDDNEDVVSYDPHLNSDGSFFSIEYSLLVKKVTFNSIGEALHRFLLSQATSSPIIRISCRGTLGQIIDFDFCIDIVPDASVIAWSVADDEPAYRGRMEREFEGSTTGTGKPNIKVGEIKLHKEWEEHRKVLGLPPWVSRVDNTNFDASGSSTHLDGLRSSKTLRQWADAYCASPRKIKEFVYKKVLSSVSIFPIPLFL